MKVFISFDSKDSQLAYTLRKILKEKDIEGYLFDLDQKYDSTLHDKITSAINDSQALIAIITKDMYSPSVHEEIGYAIGKEKSLIIMLEKGANDGVLSHEREKEMFTKKDYENSCKRVLSYLENLPITSIESTSETSEKFFQKRNLFDKQSSDFGKNVNSEKLKNNITCLDKSTKPILLFSSCPVNLLDDVPVTSKEFENWLEQFRTISLKNQKLVFLKGFKKIGLDQISYFYDNPNEYSRYLEFISNGFIEQGFTNPIIRQGRTGELEKTVFLHLCWLTGAFWAFLLFCKQHYDHIHYDGDIEIIMSVRDAKDLLLMGFGGTIDDRRRWAEPWESSWYGYEKSRTDETNLKISKKTNLKMLDDGKIEKITREFSDKIANAYGLESALCYNADGSINAGLLSYFNMK